MVLDRLYRRYTVRLYLLSPLWQEIAQSWNSSRRAVNMNPINIAGSYIGDGNFVPIVAEIGINHSGSVETAKKLIRAAHDVGCSAAKFQKRTIEVVYTAEELTKPRESPFGMTNGELKRALEFGMDEYDEIVAYCDELDFTFFFSAWDEASVDFAAQLGAPCFKIASACLTDDNLLRHHLQYKKPIILSTAMSTLRQIDHAIEILGTDNLVIMHCVALYPCPGEHLNLRVIQTLKERYKTPVGWSGHELGLATTVAAVAMGANIVERHITLDRSSFGSDQSASVEPQGMQRLVRDIREVERARGDGIKRMLPEEQSIAKKLRRVDTLKLED